jgi:hypothetical protein
MVVEHVPANYTCAHALLPVRHEQAMLLCIT